MTGALATSGAGSISGMANVHATCVHAIEVAGGTHAHKSAHHGALTAPGTRR
jgi:hypothetical protein